MSKSDSPQADLHELRLSAMSCRNPALPKAGCLLVDAATTGSRPKDCYYSRLCCLFKMVMLSPDDRHRMARTSASAAPDRSETPGGTPVSIKPVAADASSQAPAMLPGIELLRGFAALSVLVLHVVVMGQWDHFPTEGPLAWFRVGWL